MNAQNETIGLFGGSFDPPHLAHVLVGTYVLSSTHVDRIVVIPTYVHPFSKKLAPYEHRLRMCELAFSDLKRVSVSDVEGVLGGESRTLRTVEHLSKEMPNKQLRLIIGSDLVKETERWHRFDQIKKMAPPLVIPRASLDIHSPLGIPPISSTEVRERLRTNEEMSGWLPEIVTEYIRTQKLYQD
ncbi:MAG: nicotinate (nicotinamide) nucleotide adenylyltransferase [Myxococcales bacterium]|nr:MAG: nicotinate (nicotinamide) nucleotide adenylyltransferase [Myxococcales bacterium]